MRDDMLVSRLQRSKVEPMERREFEAFVGSG